MENVSEPHTLGVECSTLEYTMVLFNICIQRGEKRFITSRFCMLLCDSGAVFLLTYDRGNPSLLSSQASGIVGNVGDH